jgi:hypothetical protein
MKPKTTRSMFARLTIVAGCALAVGIGFESGLDLSSRAFAQAADDHESTMDVLVMKNGTRLEGTIISETPTTIKFKGTVGGIAFEQDYQKSDIIEIKRATKKPSATPATSPTTTPATTPSTLPGTTTPAAASDSGNAAAAGTSDAKSPAAPVDPNAVKVYFIPLRGEFGEDVSQTPILSAVRDAQKQGATIIVLEMDSSTGSQLNPYSGERMTIESGMSWNYVRRAEQIFPVFNTRIPAEWTTPPRVVMVMKRATGAAAFFPFAFKEIYFTPSGVWGGIGSLSELFSGEGDEPVQEKQKSLRLGHIEGWAIFGDYDYRLVRAMSRREYVVSLKMVGGKPEWLERLPEDPSEELLTDDGKDASHDTLREMVEGTGNDVLTLTPRIAQLLGVSKGTVDSQEDLLSALGVDRHAIIIRDRGDRIMKQWSKSMDTAKSQLRTLLQEYGEVRVEPPADYDARTKARGLQLNKLRQMKSILSRFDEGLNDWAQQNLPGIPAIETRIKAIELEQALDRR